MKLTYTIAMIALAACTARPADHELATSIAKGLVAACPAGSSPADEVARNDCAGKLTELGVQPHVSIMQFSMHGVSQVEPPYAIDDIIWPGTFTVDAGALTLVTLFTK